MKEINCPNCNQRIKIIGTIGYDLYRENLLKKEQEIERLKDDNKYLNKVNIELSSEKNRLKSIIKEVRGKLYDLNYKIKEIHNVPFDISEIFEIIDLLDKEKK